jgi:NADP-dependent 3-hydroxy acid dehydrogenase YdfG
MPAPAISKSVLITGRSTAIGESTALWLAERGWKVYSTARRQESVADLEGKVAATPARDRAFDSFLRLQLRSLGA